MKVALVSWIVWAIVFFVVQSGTMYLLLRVLEWRLFISAFIATVLSVTLAYFARRSIERSSVA